MLLHDPRYYTMRRTLLGGRRNLVRVVRLDVSEEGFNISDAYIVFLEEGNDVSDEYGAILRGEDNKGFNSCCTHN